MPPQLKLKIRSACKKIKKLSELRNAVAHNPLVFKWHGPQESGHPDFMGIPNLKRLKHSKQRIIPLTNLKDLNIAVNGIALLAQFLEAASADLPNSSPRKAKNSNESLQ